MLKLLKIVDKVEKPVMLNEAVSLNISANGDCPDDITSILGKLVNLSNPSTSTQDMTPHGGHKDAMMSTIANVDSYADQAAHDYADDMGEEYANEPNPEVSDVGYMTKDLAGGLNKPKKQFKKEYPGDNPMTMEEARANELMREYKAIKEGRMDELSPKTMGSYVNKSAASLGKASYKAGSTDGTAAQLDPHIHTINKRSAGIKRATDKLTKEDNVSELSRGTLGSYAYKADKQLGTVDAVGPSHKAGIPSHYRGKNKELGKDPADKMRARKAGVKLAVDKLNREATDPRDSLPQTWRPNNTGYAWDKLATRMTSDPKDSKARKAGKQSGLKHSIKGALGSHGPKGHLPEATDKKPTDDAKKKKSEKMKAYRADRDKNGED